jgi:plastocyanin
MTPLRLASLACLTGYSALSLAATRPNLPADRAVICQTSPTAAGAGCQDITGTILIKKKLTKRSVTASVSVYQRGTAVELGKDTEVDPLAFERSRVVIYLEGPSPEGIGPAKSAALPMQQLDRRFTPDLVVVPVGATVSFPNMDPIFHNIFSLSKPKSFDLGSYDKSESRSVVFSKPGVVYVYCHLHPNMEATIVVTPNRWYARSDRLGQYRIPDVPPGRYAIVAWHKAAGFFRKSVLIEAGHNSVVDFFVPISDDPQEKTSTSGVFMSTVKGR